MEILTLLKANIRSKKGTFISIVLLMTIIVTTMTSVFSVRDNYNHALEQSLEESGCGDTTVIIKTSRLTEELRSKVENSELVGSVWYQNAICGNGMHYGEQTDGNSQFLMLLHDGIRLYNENLDGFEAEIPELHSGEIYLPLGLRSKIGCQVGGTVTIDFIFGIQHEFVIKGFVEEPSQGAMTIGWKQVFISEEDFERISAECIVFEEQDVSVDFTIMRIRQAADSELSATKFQRLLNLETKLISQAAGALSREQTIRYSTLLPQMVTNVILVFVTFLFVIVLIVMSHSISTEIEIDYVTLGVLKSQGFSKEKIRVVFLLQYLLAQLIGVVLGSIAAVPIEREISRLCQSITGVLPNEGLAVGKSIVLVAAILLLSAGLIFVKTGRIGKISPVRAISGGREEIYFDSRLNAPITKNPLSASIALRQITSNKKRYIGTLCIVSILTFFMITVNLIDNMLSSREALAAMGLIIPDIEVHYTEETEEDYLARAVELTEANAELTYKNSEASCYASLNGENILCTYFRYPENIRGILKGRAPIYENEVLITEMVAEALEISMGDTVTVSFRDKEESFVVSGIFQSGSDSGMNFALNFDGAEKVGIDTSYTYLYFILKDKTKTEEVAQKISEAYGDVLGVYVYDDEENPVVGEYDAIVSALQIFIYAFSILFAFVVVRMVCAKTFIQERTDIGIYKAIGFTSGKLRLSFAVRFLIISLLGAGLGIGLSLLFSDEMLNAVMSLIGLTKVALEFNTMTVLLPAVAIGISFFVFAYVAARKIKTVEVRELVTE